MNIVSPLQTKLTITMPSRFRPNENDNRPMKHLDEHALFLLLEIERNKKLRELYRGNSLMAPKSGPNSHQDVALPKFPPRYHCLDLSAEWIVSEVNKQRWDFLSMHNSTKDQWRTGLDQVTKMFLEDAVYVLRDRYSGGDGSSQTRSLAPPCIPSLSPTCITPPSSPLTLPLVASEDSMMAPRTHHAGGRRKEVDMSDDEIMSLWNCAVPSEI